MVGPPRISLECGGESAPSFAFCFELGSPAPQAGILSGHPDPNSGMNPG